MWVTRESLTEDLEGVMAQYRVWGGMHCGRKATLKLWLSVMRLEYLMARLELKTDIDKFLEQTGKAPSKREFNEMSKSAFKRVDRKTKKEYKELTEMWVPRVGIGWTDKLAREGTQLIHYVGFLLPGRIIESLPNYLPPNQRVPLPPLLGSAFVETLEEDSYSEAVETETPGNARPESGSGLPSKSQVWILRGVLSIGLCFVAYVMAQVLSGDLPW
jgi:hypothetical protein